MIADLACQYAAQVESTDVLPRAPLTPILFGLFGEVGGIMSTAKKFVREGRAYPGHRRAALEEFGDTLWYLAALCRRTGTRLDSTLTDALEQCPSTSGLAQRTLMANASGESNPPIGPDPLDVALLDLGGSAADLLHSSVDPNGLVKFSRNYLKALGAAGIDLAEVAASNARKARGAFLQPEPSELKDFDANFDEEERLPATFRVRISQRASGKSYLQWRGVFIGDPLTDNIEDADGYRFHDVFHFANAAILHWSPVVRALIKHKRKSDPLIDEAQDGGRALVVEEGLTAWLFNRAKELNFFEGQDRVSLGILKNVQEFTSGFEVSSCSPKLWERSILDGYAVFRQVRDGNGGWLIGDRSTRTIRFEPLGSDT